MAERVDIWNSALGHAAQGTIIASEHENTEAARACRRFYPQCRRSIFAAHPWRFAKRISTLTAITPTPPGSLYSYPVPSGFSEIRGVSVLDPTNDPERVPLVQEDLRVSNFYASAPLAQPLPKVEWELAGITDAQGNDLTVIRTNTEVGFVHWQRVIENEALYPEQFTTALEHLLACNLANTFVREQARRAELFERYAAWLSEARAADQRQVYERVEYGDILQGRV